MLVVLLVNISIPDGLVNGSQGTVVGFKEFWDPEEEEKSEHEILAGKSILYPVVQLCLQP